ncbi:MAG: VCBS repeat-containing protein [Acidobacteria bacterium]|nr:VCBS repeat-containing protein [Acidobacteriota bacterium]
MKRNLLTIVTWVVTLFLTLSQPATPARGPTESSLPAETRPGATFEQWEGVLPASYRTPAVGEVTVRASGRGYPWINLADGRDLPIFYPEKDAVGVLKNHAMRPLSLAAADFDEDGVPDLVSGYEAAGAGFLLVQRGNIDFLHPYTAGAQQRKASGEVNSFPFAPQAIVVELPAAPDFLGSGDFDADGHWDLVAAARGSNLVHWASGDGRGAFTAAREIALPGTVTALATGDVNRADGLEDILVGVSGKNGPELLVFEGPAGALAEGTAAGGRDKGAEGLLHRPESFPLDAEAVSIVTGQLNLDYPTDVAVAAGTELLIIYGRDHRLSWNQESRQQVGPATTERLQFSVAIRSIAAGDFRGNGSAALALLFNDGRLELWDADIERERQQLQSNGATTAAESSALSHAQSGDVHRAWKRSWNPGAVLQAPPSSQALSALLVRTRAASIAKDALLVIDSVSRQLHLWVENEVSDGRSDNFTKLESGSLLISETLQMQESPVSVLPMRLNGDALTDLAILKSGGHPIVWAETAPGAIITVNSSGDTSARDAVLTLREAMSIANGSLAVSSLTSAERAQVSGTPANPGLDEIRFAGVTSITVGVGGFPSPGTSNPITIDARSAGRVEVKQAGNAGVQVSVSTGNSTIRNLAIGGIRMGTRGSNVVAGNYLGFDLNQNTFASPGSSYGISADNGSTDNRIGGTTAADRNVIAMSGFARDDLSISGGSHRNQVLGNYAGTDVAQARRPRAIDAESRL